MTVYIDGEKFVEFESKETCFGYDDLLEKFLMKYGAADVEPVVHAHWIHDFIDADWHCGLEIHLGWVCSCCNGYLDMEDATNYCPHCGAKMDGEAE